MKNIPFLTRLNLLAWCTARGSFILVVHLKKDNTNVNTGFGDLMFFFSSEPLVTVSI